MLKRTFKLFFSGIAASILLFSCGSSEQGNLPEEENKIDSNQSITVNVEGKIFSIPSPIQTALLIKKTGAPYAKEVLNPHDKANTYSTNYKKALNLGVYGADLGYITLYDQTQDALGYFKAIQKLSDDLGMSSAFDKALLERFNKNLGKQDSMLMLVSGAFRATDNFLKSADRSSLSAIIIAGGWIEALYFATNIVQQKNAEEVIRRIAEQKTSLENLMGLLEVNNSNNELDELIKGLSALKDDFAGITYKYTYEKPITEAQKKLTTITSKTEVSITPEQLTSISKKVNELRKLIVS